MLRALAGTPAGRLHLSIIDPVAIGRSFAEFLHLGDYDERLVDTRPRTSSRDIETRLEEHAAHLETMIAKYLRGQFPTIRDYNSQAEEMAEPYRLLVVCDYPTQFSDRSSELLLSLVQNGPRCGLYSLSLIHILPARLPKSSPATQGGGREGGHPPPANYLPLKKPM